MTAAEILAAIPNLSALVVGDICLDRWCTYDPATIEPSRETGIPRIGVVRDRGDRGSRRHGGQQPGRLGLWPRGRARRCW